MRILEQTKKNEQLKLKKKKAQLNLKKKILKSKTKPSKPKATKPSKPKAIATKPIATKATEALVNIKSKYNTVIPKTRTKYGRVLIVGTDQYMCQLSKPIAKDVLTIGINNMYNLFWPKYLFFNDIVILENIEKMGYIVPPTTTLVISDYTVDYYKDKRVHRLCKKYNVVVHIRNNKETHVFTLLNVFDALPDFVKSVNVLDIYLCGISLDQNNLKHAFYNVKDITKTSLKNQLTRFNKLIKTVPLNLTLYKTNTNAIFNCQYKCIEALYKPPLNIIHVRQTKIAYAVEAIDHIFKIHSDYTTSIIVGNDTKSISAAIRPNKINVLHFHNKYIKHPKNIKWPCFEMIQYHSPPSVVMLNIPNHVYKIVLNQLHCTLPEYANMRTVSNPIILRSIEDNRYIHKNDLTIRIAYSPSSLKSNNGLPDKGYSQTKQILDKLQKQFIGKLHVFIITNTPLIDCLYLKSMSDIVIDECITGGFHRSSLEGLSLGKVVICKIDPKLKIKHPDLPIINSDIGSLEKTIKDLLYTGKKNLEKMGNKNKDWFNINWNNTKICREFENIYSTLIST